MPWTEQEVLAVLEHLDKQLAGLEGMPAALLAKDSFLFAILWQTKSRGCNARMWHLDNLKLPTGSMSPEISLFQCVL